MHPGWPIVSTVASEQEGSGLSCVVFDAEKNSLEKFGFLFWLLEKGHILFFFFNLNYLLVNAEMR